ncbi:hypothetical protein ACIRBX_04795 [Kitasatospora sp. NPDC096147]|uniref:hypothetical protein n=1 Tax=Kitasatospora sp. NPDC096147 TaxID=3364093 RepID=UPI0037F822FE
MPFHDPTALPVLDLLRADGSWQLTEVDGVLESAVYRHTPGAERGALVERLVAGGAATVDPGDPEQWEGALIEALLSHPAADGLTGLELHLTDYHHSAEHAAAALARRERPRLHHLHLGNAFEYLFEDGLTSTGRPLDPLERHGAALVRTEPWAALPALRSLELEGAFLVDAIDHPGLTRLRTRGAVISDGSVFSPGRLPALTDFAVSLESDVFGVACSIDQVAELGAGRFPALRRLDLGLVEFDSHAFDTLAAFAGSPLLPQLESLTLRSLELERWHCAEAADPEPAVVLAALAPAFAHLTLRVVGPVTVESDDPARADAALALLGLRIGAGGAGGA